MRQNKHPSGRNQANPHAPLDERSGKPLRLQNAPYEKHSSSGTAFAAGETSWNSTDSLLGVGTRRRGEETSSYPEKNYLGKEGQVSKNRMGRRVRYGFPLIPGRSLLNSHAARTPVTGAIRTFTGFPVEDEGGLALSTSTFLATTCPVHRSIKHGPGCGRIPAVRRRFRCVPVPPPPLPSFRVPCETTFATSPSTLSSKLSVFR